MWPCRKQGLFLCLTNLCEKLRYFILGNVGQNNLELHSLNEHVFFDLEDAINKINEWHDRYNNHNPHSSLGMLTPVEFGKRDDSMLSA